MTKRRGIAAGRDQFEASRGRGEKPADSALVKSAVGRGQLVHRARAGDREARNLLIHHGRGGDLELGGDDAA